MAHANDNIVDDDPCDPSIVAELMAIYPDFHDVANALMDRYAAGLVTGDVVDEAFRANGWSLPI